MICDLGNLEFEKTKRKHRGWISDDFRASLTTAELHGSLARVIAMAHAVFEVPKLRGLAIIPGVPCGCPDQDEEQAGVR